MAWTGANADRLVGGPTKKEISSPPEQEVAPKSIEELVEAQRRRIRCGASHAAALAGWEELRWRRHAAQVSKQPEFIPFAELIESEAKQPVPKPSAEARVLPRPDGQEWQRVALSEGIAFEVPTNWIVTGAHEREAIDALGTVLSPNSTLKGRIGFGATLRASDEKKILAQMGIRFYVDSAADDILQADIENATWEEIQELDKKLREGHELSLPKPSLWRGTRRVWAGEFTSLQSVYAARFAHESFDRCFVRVRAYDGKLSFSLLLNYEESSGTSLRPVIDRIIRH
jgi:hypothetical protein